MGRRRCGLAACALALMLAAPAGAHEHEPDPTTTTQGSGNPFKAVKGLFGGGQDEDEQAGATALARYRSDGFDFTSLVKDRPEIRRVYRSMGHGVIDHDRLKAYLNKVAADIVAAGPEPGIPVVVHPVAVTEFKAATYPDGSIVVGLGMLLDLENEDELAFVLSHELAHVIYRHRGMDSLIEAQRKLMKTARIGLQLVEGFNQIAGKEAVDTDDAQKAVLIGTAVHQASDIIIGPAFTREEEDAADRLGVDLFLKAGYGYGAIASFFEKQIAWETDPARQPARRTEAEREQAMNEAVRKDGIAGLFKEAGSAFKQGIGELKADLSKQHDDAEKRADKVNAYLEKHYEDAEAVAPRPLPWKGGGDKAVARLLANYVAAQEVTPALERGDVAEAERLARKGIGRPTSSHGFTRHAFYRVRAQQGRHELAMKNLELARRGNEPSLVVYKTLVGETQRAGDHGAAVAYLDEARQRLDDPPGLLPLRIRLYKQSERDEDLLSLVLQCEYDYPQLAKECKEAVAAAK